MLQPDKQNSDDNSPTSSANTSTTTLSPNAISTLNGGSPFVRANSQGSPYAQFKSLHIVDEHGARQQLKF